jgi:hypothetical protein
LKLSLILFLLAVSNKHLTHLLQCFSVLDSPRGKPISLVVSEYKANMKKSILFLY